MENSNVGYLIVNASTARGAIPVEGASVTVFDEAEGRQIIALATTDSSGKSALIELPAPNRELAMTPGGSKPFASYAVEVAREGYYTVTNSGVPIFAGITSIQPVELIPLAEYDSAEVYPRGSLEIDDAEGNTLSGGDV